MAEADDGAVEPEGRSLRSGPLRVTQAAVGTIAILLAVVVIMLPEFGTELPFAPPGRASDMIASLSLVLGAVFVGASLRRFRPVALPAPAGQPLLQVLSLVGIVSGLGLLLLPTLDLQVSGLAPYEGLLGAGLVAIGFALMIGAVVRAPQKLVEVDFGNPWTLVVGILTLRWFRKSWAVIDASAEAQRTEEPQEGFDPAPLAALLTGAVLLSMMEYFGHGVVLHQVIDQLAPPGAEPSFFTMLRDSRFPRLLDFAWWSGWRILGFLLIPALVWKVGLGRPLVAAGLQTRGFLSHAWVYAFFFGFVVLLVVGVSFGPQFQQYYPFYREASRSGYDLLAWEILYAAQFFSLEFFFRGFWLESCRRSMGAQAVFVMVVPYCMIHFGKPYPETLGAILAGVMLGTLAMRTRSIWGGFLIHVSIAVSMDVAALLQTRGLPSTLVALRLRSGAQASFMTRRV